MNTVNYSDILSGSAGLSGTMLADVGVAEFALYELFHDKRLQEAWECHHWPDLCPTEQRYFRPLWNATYAAATGYNLGDQRFDVATQNYFQSLVAANSQPPTVAGAENSAYWAQLAKAYSAEPWVPNVAMTVGFKVLNPADWNYYQCIVAHTSGATLAANAADWGLLTPFSRYIAANQVEDNGTVHTPIGDFLSATDMDPRVTSKTVQFFFELSPNGAQFTNLKHSIAYCWLKFRTPRPVLNGQPWNQLTAYAAGVQVYYVTAAGPGNFYTSIASTAAGQSPDTNPASWAVVPLPYIFCSYMITGGYTDWLRSDGQGDKANDMEPVAQHFLELELDKLQRQSQQVNRLTWRR